MTESLICECGERETSTVVETLKPHWMGTVDELLQSEQMAPFSLLTSGMLFRAALWVLCSLQGCRQSRIVPL